MITNIITIGMGVFLPFGELINTFPSGREINIIYGFPQFNAIDIKVISFQRSNLIIEIFKYSCGIKFKIYKDIHIEAGTGIYYAREKFNKGFESDYGNCHYLGLIYNFNFNKNVHIYPELLYSTVPRGLSLTLNISIEK